MAKTVTPSEFAEAVGISRSTVLRWCKSAVAEGHDWCSRDDAGRWTIHEKKARAAIESRSSKRPAAAKVRRASSARRTKSTRGKRAPRTSRAEEPSTRSPPNEGAEPGISELAVLDDQISAYQAVILGVKATLEEQPLSVDANKAMKDASVEIRQLMKRRREVLEADAMMISRGDADRRLIELAAAQRREWDALARKFPAAIVAELSKHGVEFDDAGYVTRVLTEWIRGGVEKTLTKLADAVSKEPS